MRLFLDCQEMDSEVKRDMHEMGTRVHPPTMQDLDVRDNPDYETMELSPYGFMVERGGDRDQLLERRGMSLDWARADFKERITPGVNPGEAWKFRESTWAPFIHDGVFAYTYSERYNRVLYNEHGTASGTALGKIIEQLSHNGATRQAILPVFYGDDDLPNLGGKARVPCSLHYQFLVRKNVLEMIYVMRSSDFATHFPYDIWMAMELQSHIANLIGAHVGRFTFFTGSLHLYRKDADEGTF